MTTLRWTRWHRFATMLAVASLLLQAVAVAIHAPAMSGLTASAVAGPLQSIVICSQHGTRTITVDAQGNPVEAPLPADSQLRCPMCLVLGGFALSGPVGAATILNGTAAPELAWPLPVAVSCVASARIHGNRGPPALIPV